MSKKCRDCKGIGWCERHQIFKPATLVNICRKRGDIFELWEQGIGPGQTDNPIKPSKNKGLGDSLETVLTTLGITKDRYVEVKKLFGLPPTCNCDQRREWLNKVGEWFSGKSTDLT